MKDFSACRACWIWDDRGQPHENHYVEFRREFRLDQPPAADATLSLSVDSNYVLWLNGTFVDCGQYSDFPGAKTFDALEVGAHLRQGANALCLLVYHYGRTCHIYLKGDPGLVYVLEAGDVRIVSDEDTNCRQSKAYLSGPIYQINQFISFAFHYDAAKEDDWTSDDYRMERGWSKAQVRENPAFHGGIVLNERPVEKLRVRDRVKAEILAQGVFLRTDEAGKNVGQLMQSDYLSYRTLTEVSQGSFDGKLPSEGGLLANTEILGPEEGIYLVVDLGREEAGFLDLEVDSASGTVMDVAFGEQLDDLRVRAAEHDRYYAVRYVCKGGRQSYTHAIKRLAYRYLQLHIRAPRGSRFRLHYAGIKPSELPLERNGAFTCQDGLHNKIYEVCMRTLELCMHEHYEDTPLREQALYGMDSRNQALCGYYCFGNYGFASASFDLLAHGQREDGFLPLVAPSYNRITIPHYSMLWINAVWDCCLYGGRTEVAVKHMPVVDRIMESCLKCVEDGLMTAPRGPGYWHNYEWSRGLTGYDDMDREIPVDDARYDAPLNAFFCLALDDASKLAEAAGQPAKAARYRDAARSIRKGFHAKFWNKSKQIYDNYAGGTTGNAYDSETTQAVAVCAGVCPAEIAAQLRQRIASDHSGLEKTTLSYSIYKFSALLEDPERYASSVFRMVTEDWGSMLFNRATSFWETIEGSRGFDNSGSTCHGWSAVPAYLYQAYILGVKPLKPGFELFEVRPILPGIGRASGTVPTPHGTISVSVVGSGDAIECQVSHPEGTTCRKVLPGQT
jgi:alpha-L-rhamnosidase